MSTNTQIIRKILKANLTGLGATSSIVLSVTDTGEIFINKQDGEHLKISDFVVVENTQALSTVNLINGKFYFIKDIVDIQYYNGVKLLSIKDTMKQLIATVNEEIAIIKANVNTNSENISATNTKLVQEVDTLTRSISALSDDIDTKIAALLEADTTMNAKIVEIDNSVFNLKSSVSTLETGISELSIALDSYKATSDEATISISAIKKDVASLTENATTMSDAIDTMNTSITDIKNTQVSIGNSVTNIEGRLARRDYKAVYDITKLKAGELNPRIIAEAYLFEAGENIVITEIKVKTKTMKEYNVGVTLNHIAELDSGETGITTTLGNVSLLANSYKNNVLLNKSINNGAIVPVIDGEITEATDLTVIICFHILAVTV